jgi:hypothetical protein
MNYDGMRDDIVELFNEADGLRRGRPKRPVVDGFWRRPWASPSRKPLHFAVAPQLKTVVQNMRYAKSVMPLPVRSATPCVICGAPMEIREGVARPIHLGRCGRPPVDARSGAR